jgi:hypothetical protein
VNKAVEEAVGEAGDEGEEEVGDGNTEMEGIATSTSTPAPTPVSASASSGADNTLRLQLQYLLSQREKTIADLEGQVRRLTKERDARPAPSNIESIASPVNDKDTSVSVGSNANNAAGGVNTLDSTGIPVGGTVGLYGLTGPVLEQYYEHYAALRLDIQQKLNERISKLNLSQQKLPRAVLHLLNVLHYNLVHEVATHSVDKLVYNSRLLQLERVVHERAVDARLMELKVQELEGQLLEKDAVIRKAERSLLQSAQKQHRSQTQARSPNDGGRAE